MQWLFTKYGKLLTCFLLSCVVYILITSMYSKITNEVIKENEENKEKRLIYIIDR